MRFSSLIDFFVFQFSPDVLVTWDNLTGGEAGDSGIINMEDEDDDDLSDQVTVQYVFFTLVKSDF